MIDCKIKVQQIMKCYFLLNTSLKKLNSVFFLPFLAPLHPSYKNSLFIL